MALFTYERCLEVLTLLELQTYFPKQITRQLALTLTENVITRTNLKHPRQIPWFILQNIIACNYEGISFELDRQTHIATKCTSLSLFLDDESFEANDDSTNDELQVHPLDALTSLFLCCDDFLRQILVEKLSQCQLGIPLLIPVIEAAPGTPAIEMLSWATSTLRKQWKTCTDPPREHSMAVHPLPVVSALRVGRPKLSKSKLLSRTINSKHDCFLNNECKGGNVKKVISNGVLQMTWYLPMGNEEDDFQSAFGVVNLRGNIASFPVQREFLTKISSTNIIFCQSDMLNKEDMHLLTSWKGTNSHLILVFDGIPNQEWKPILKSVHTTYKGGKQEFCWIVKDEAKDLAKSLKDALKQCMSVKFSNQTSPKSLEDCETIATSLNIRIDDKDIGDNFDSKLKANELMECLEKNEPKEHHLPLQLLACKVAEKKRERFTMYLRKGRQVESYLEMVSSEIKALRETQFNLWKNESEMRILKLFLGSVAFTSVGRSYFYNWTSIMLDRYSVGRLQSIREKYNDAWTKSKYQNFEMSNLESFQDNLFNASFGLENLNREISQIYEMSSELSKLELHIQKFPEIAAEMLIDGHPLEIMDGDATDVPVAWLNAVFTHLKAKIENKKVFVLSIVGVQGSGKSTMLNTMFGLKFAVGAGRCTKGAFAQLIPLDENLRIKSKSDYILVVDTEGLRPPEFASIEHSNCARDNEMATFILGLADATIINILGENQSDIQDILQIVVHALMKMNFVNLNPSCIFVHQNISDVSAAQKSTTQKITLKKLLDETTKIASDVQGHTFNSFADVIDFQDKHVVYISNLWQGDPPMAPPNPGYVRCVLDLKKMITSLMAERNGNGLDEFRYKLTALWKAVLCEDFVFSFKNALEIQVYTALENVYLEVSRDFRQTCMSNCNDLVNACRTIPVTTFEEESKKLFEDHESKLKKSYKTCFLIMQDYFENNPRAEHWRQNIKDKISELDRAMRNTLREEFKIVKQTVMWKSKIDQDMTKYELEIRKKSRELANKFRGSDKSELELEEQFNTSWSMWIEDVPGLTNLMNVEVKLEDILLETFKQEKHVIKELLKVKDLNTIKVSKDDLKKKKHGINPFSKTESCLQEVNLIVSKCRKSAISMIDYDKRMGNNCNEHTLKEQVDVVSKLLSNLPTSENVSFTHEGTAKHTFCILWKLIPEYKALQKAFREQNEPRAIMTSKRQTLWQIFQNECTKVEIALTTAFKVSLLLRDATEKVIKQLFLEDVLYHFRTSLDHKHTFANKKSFHAQMLIDLAERNSFESSKGYLENPSFCMSRWLHDYIISALQLESDSARVMILRTIYCKCVRRIYQEVVEEINRSCRLLMPTCKINNLWKKVSQTFKQTTKIQVTTNQTQLVCEDEEIQVEDFVRELSAELKQAEENLKAVSNADLENILKKEIGEVVTFFENDLIGCQEVCPFCKAVCDNIAECTTHETEFHRPQGVGGFYWDDTKKLVTDVCTTAVGRSDQSFKHTDIDDKWHVFSEYHSVNKQYKSWTIVPTSDPTTQLYWKWFMAKYNKQLADFYGCKEADIPDGWRDITLETVKKEMMALYNINKGLPQQ